MKTVFIIILATILSYTCYISLGGDNLNEWTGDLKNDIENIFNKYDNSAYKSLYSLDEIHNYSIIQLDKSDEMYENEWLEPKRIVKTLQNEDKKKLKKSLLNYISKDSGNASAMLSKIKYWSASDKLLELLKEFYDVNDKTMIEALLIHPQTSYILNRFDQRRDIRADSLNEKQSDQALNNAINYISGLDKSSQFRYYSELFNILANKSLEKN